ncbi:MAG TPA: chaperone modulator CbpM [Burkholderiales bacterium]|nr:chaperone modulator CbpM [Burkholderiales bacterium]
MKPGSSNAANAIEASWLHESTDISLDDLAEISGLPATTLRELVEYGALVPNDTRSQEWRFTADCVVAVRTAGRLRADFELDANALAIALNLVERIGRLEAELQSLRSQFPALRAR